MISGPIQTQPEGLLALLALKNKGRNPEFLGDTILPVISLEEWLAVQDKEFIQVAGTYAGPYHAIATCDPLDIAAYPAPQVPQGEVWYVWNVSGQVVLSGGNTAVYNLATAVQLVSGVGAYITLDHSVALASSGLVNNGYAGWGRDVRRWFKAGSVFGLGYAIDLVDPTDIASFGMTIEVTRLKV